MRGTWISAAAAAAIMLDAAGYAAAQQRQAGQDPAPTAQGQKDRDPPPGFENMDKRAERAQTAAPTGGSPEQKPADTKGMRQQGKPGGD
jgi:hypothetical protein